MRSSRRATAWGSLLGAACGLIVASLVSVFTQWSFFWHGPIGLVCTAGPGYLFSLAMAPPPTEKIQGLVYGMRTHVAVPVASAVHEARQA